MPNKRFEAAAFFITYPQLNNIDNAKQRLLDFFQQLALSHSSTLQYCLIGHERHQDGGHHYHCVAHFSTKLRLRERSFDFEQHHPNIRTVGRKKSDWTNVVQYTRKEDEQPLEFGSPRHSCKSVWSEVAQASSREEAESLIQSEQPRDWIINRRQLDYALDKMFPVQENPQSGSNYSFSYQNLPDQLVNWKLCNFEYVH